MSFYAEFSLNYKKIIYLKLIFNHSNDLPLFSIDFLTRVLVEVNLEVIKEGFYKVMKKIKN